MAGRQPCDLQQLTASCGGCFIIKLPDNEKLAVATNRLMNKEPSLLCQRSRGLSYSQPPWNTTYTDDYRWHALEANATHSSPPDQQQIWCEPHRKGRGFVKKPVSSHGNEIAGLQSGSSINLVKWQDKKPITQTNPSELLSKDRDMRRLISNDWQRPCGDLLSGSSGKLEPQSMSIPRVTRRPINWYPKTQCQYRVSDSEKPNHKLV